MVGHSALWAEVSTAVRDFQADLTESNASNNMTLLIFSEFGRRAHDNGSGTDHGSGGIAFVVGDNVKGGVYGEYPSLAENKLLEGDLHYNNDFRGLYSTLLEKWIGIDAQPVVGGNFEQMAFI